MGVRLPSADAIETELCRLRGVAAARVVIADGQVSEIHILASSLRPVKQVVRDIEALFAAHFRVEIDHRCISVAQLDIPLPEDDILPRVELTSVRMEMLSNDMAVAVELRVGEKVFTGEARCLRVSTKRSQLAAKATMQALQALLGDECRLELNQLKEFQLGQHRGYAVVVSLLSRRGEEKLIGCALVKEDAQEAGARAVLDAVNRRLGRPRVAS